MSLFTFFNVTFLTTICEIAYNPPMVSNCRPWDDLLPVDSNTFHCAAEDYGHILLFAYLYFILR